MEKRLRPLFTLLGMYKSLQEHKRAADLGNRLGSCNMLLPYLSLVDRFRTATNVLGDSYGAGVVAHLCRKELAEDKHAPLEYLSESVRTCEAAEWVE
ncbi:hypothetical protein C0Q70_11264 [Pomacea canaliculata]|uniref:Amino acid transporter n=1 Tax=Pomacea canaliculata TaxID=400727 RepID=A0A2T7P5H9_POMCA|nr:hypothetical protein C0Q70_11264 [Pomacea canaliculata]